MPYHRDPRRQDAPEVLGGAGMTLLEPPGKLHAGALA